jgi:hypothetical protein
VTSPEERHENGPSLRTAHRSIPEIVFAHDDRETDLPFGMVITRRHARMKQEGKKFVAVLGKLP